MPGRALLAVLTRAADWLRGSNLRRPKRRVRSPHFEQYESRDLLTSVTLTPAADNTIFEDATSNSNGAGPFLFAGDTFNHGAHRALLKFDVAGSVPAGAHIDNVTLKLHVAQDKGILGNFGVYLMQASWGEGTSNSGTGAGRGDGTSATTADATWNDRFFPATTWTNPGGDFNSSASATATLSSVGFHEWTGAGLAADVQGWLNSPSTQLGWMIRATDDNVQQPTPGTAQEFDSKESLTVANRPTLTINYTAAAQPNQQPTLNAINDPAAILEDAAQQTVSLSGISAGTGETQTLTITATSSNPALIPNPTVVYTSPSATGSIKYTPLANASGSAVITVTLKDDGGTANGGVDTITRSFTVNVTSVNDPPTLNAISDPTAILEDAGQQTINFGGITAGPSETQNLSVSVSSSNPTLISTPTVNYTSPNNSGSLTYTPATNRSGSAVITVTVKDDGGTANGGSDTISRSFTVNVTPLNDPPTLNAITSPPAILEDAGQQSISLQGISAGPLESQNISVSATTDNPTLLPSFSVVYTSPNATGTLNYTPAANRSGTATVTVTVKDDGGTASGGIDTVTRTFTVSVTPVNDPPTLNAISDPTAIVENSGQQTVNLSGISAGPFESQTIQITATSSNPGLIPNPTVIYTSPNATGSLNYAPVSGQTGSAVITVTVTDDGGTANSGVDTITRTFTVQVIPPGFVNQPPSFQNGPDESGTDEGGQVSVLGWATSISPGSPSESSQTVTFSLANGNNALFSAQPNIDPTGKLTFTPAPNAHGSTIVTVLLKDNGGTANGGNDTSASQTFNITVTKPHPWHNTLNRLDVTGDGHVFPNDALAVINHLNAFGSGPIPPNPPFGPPYLDVDNDGSVVPRDALSVINVINAGQAGEGESALDPAPLDAFYSNLGSLTVATPASSDLLTLLLTASDPTTSNHRR